MPETVEYINRPAPPTEMVVPLQSVHPREVCRLAHMTYDEALRNDGFFFVLPPPASKKDEVGGIMIDIMSTVNLAGMKRNGDTPVIKHNSVLHVARNIPGTPEEARAAEELVG